MSIEIHKATQSDYPEIHRMILDFATFQRTPEKVSITLEQMQENGEDFQALVAKNGEEYIGFATYYFGFSSWSGRHLFLDDLYLVEEHRGQGLGHLFMDKLEEIAKGEKCQSMRWLVSKWNAPAIAFYKKRGATIADTEQTCQLDFK